MLSAAYDGDFCERDRDGCATLTCFMGTECIDNMAPATGATCNNGSCPTGYTGDGVTCLGEIHCTNS